MYKQAPLPFIGQKRQFLKHFEAVLNENIPGDGDGWTIIDTFGGSGLLSHVAKQLKPKARVIYNDFDGYAERLAHIDDINALRAQLYNTVNNVTRKKKISRELRAELIRIIQDFDGYKDLNSIASWLQFSGNQASSLEDLFSRDFWHLVRKTDYPSAEGYLDGLEVVHESFHTLLPQFINDPKAVFVLDPPYLCTRQDSYKQSTYFDLIDFLRLVHITRAPYIFFSSTKSEFPRFIEYMQEDKVDNWQAFVDAKRIAINASASHLGNYEDNMVYKF